LNVSYFLKHLAHVSLFAMSFPLQSWHTYHIICIFYETLHIVLEPYEVSRWTNHLQKKTGPKNQILNKRSLIELKNKHWA
jgi:hypothetical protein